MLRYSVVVFILSAEGETNKYVANDVNAFLHSAVKLLLNSVTMKQLQTAKYFNTCVTCNVMKDCLTRRHSAISQHLFEPCAVNFLNHSKHSVGIDYSLHGNFVF